jgi:hypothetical protein
LLQDFKPVTNSSSYFPIYWKSGKITSKLVTYTMSQICQEFHTMETMLEKIKNPNELRSTNNLVQDERCLEQTRNEIEFKLRIGHSEIWTNIQKVDQFLERAIA